MERWRMFFHFIMRAIWHRKSRTVAAFSAIILGTGVIGGLFNVYYDVSNKMSKEFRTYGANLLIYPTDKNSGLSLEQVHKIGQQIPSGKIIGMTPNQYSMVYVENQPLVLVGIWFDQMKKVSPYWNVDGEWVTERGNREEAMVGVEVAEKYGVKPGGEIKLKAENTGKQMAVKVKGIVSTGGKEDNQIFVSMDLAGQLTGETKGDIVLVNLLERGKMLEQAAKNLQSDIPEVSIIPLKQISQSEDQLLGKIHQLIYFVAVIIFIITLLTVTMTMMSMIMERRKEIGLKKALGASDKKLLTEFLVEGGIIGFLGSTLGILLSYYFAMLIGKMVFDAEISFRFAIVPWLYISSFVVIGTAFMFSLRRIAEIEPALVLKGE